MNDLKTEFENAVGNTLIDTERLVHVAVRRGTRIRRVRVAMAAGAIAATLAVAIGVPATVTVIRGEEPSPPVVTNPVPAPKAEPVPLTGRATAAALRELVGQRVTGKFTRFEGQDTDLQTAADDPDLVATYAKFWLEQTGAARATPVMVNVTNGWPSPDSCAQFKKAASCRVVRTGSWTIVLVQQPDGPTVSRQVYAYDAGRSLRVAVRSSNGEDFEKVGPDKRAPRAVTDQGPLSLADLQAIATWSGWGPTIDQKYAELGAALSPYADYSDKTPAR